MQRRRGGSIYTPCSRKRGLAAWGPKKRAVGDMNVFTKKSDQDKADEANFLWPK